MNKEQVLGIVRHILTSFGGAATSTGIVTSDQYTAAVGAIVTIAGLVWSIWFTPEKKK